MYGDKRSDNTGNNARTNIGASGDIFTLLENSLYHGFADPKEGTSNKAGHENVDRYSYFVKTFGVRTSENVIEYYDMVVNVKEKATGSYVYTIQINENKTRKQPLAAQATDIGAGLKSQEAASLFSIIPRNERDVKPLEEKKLKQLEIIQQTNPMTDDYHTGIRSVDDIKTAEEVFTDDPDDYIYPDFTVEDGQRALETGEVTVYSIYYISFISLLKSRKIDVIANPAAQNMRRYKLPEFSSIIPARTDAIGIIP